MKRSNWILFGLVLVMIAGTAFLLQHFKTNQKLGNPGVKIGAVALYDTKTNLVANNSVILPEISGYKSSPLPVTPIELTALPSDTTFGKRRYSQTNGTMIDLNVVVMGRDRTSLHKPEICLVSQGLNVDQRELAQVPMNRPYPYTLPVMKLTSTSHGKNESGQPVTIRGIFVYWFVDNEKITARHEERMWWMAKDLLQDRVLNRWSYISYFSLCLPGHEEETFRSMQEFIAASAPEFQTPAGKSLRSVSQTNVQTAFK
jgi:hypothetical protein